MPGAGWRPGSPEGCGWAHPETTWRASANQRADRTLRLGFKQTTVRRERPLGPRPLAWVWGPARRWAGGGAESGGGAQWSSDGRPHLFGVRAAERWTPQPMGGGEGEGRPAAWGRGGRRGRAPNPVPSGSPTTPAAGPSSSGGGRSGCGQATQLREGSRRAAALRHTALARPFATMPKRKVSSGRVPHTPTPPPGRPQSHARPRPAAVGRGGGRSCGEWAAGDSGTFGGRRSLGGRFERCGEGS